MLKCAILKEIFYQDSISGIKKIAYEKNKGRNRQMEDADVSQKVLKQLYKTEFNKLTPEDIESVKRLIYKYMNQSRATDYEVKLLVNPVNILTSFVTVIMNKMFLIIIMNVIKKNKQKIIITIYVFGQY